MRLVTKKEFESALEVIQSALDNKQLKSAFHDIIVSKMLFVDGQDVFRKDEISFTPPMEVAKNRLFKIRKLLRETREEQGKRDKSLGNLESEEKELAKLLLALKEE